MVPAHLVGVKIRITSHLAQIAEEMILGAHLRTKILGLIAQLLKPQMGEEPPPGMITGTLVTIREVIIGAAIREEKITMVELGLPRQHYLVEAGLMLELGQRARMLDGKAYACCAYICIPFGFYSPFEASS